MFNYYRLIGVIAVIVSGYVAVSIIMYVYNAFPLSYL